MHQYRVAVGLGLGDGADPDRAARARPVLDDERLAELLRQALRHRARHDVRGAAGREGHDDLHPLGRPRLRLRRAVKRCTPPRQRQPTSQIVS